MISTAELLAYIRGDPESEEPIGRCRTHDTRTVPSLPQNFPPSTGTANKRVTSNGSPHSPSGTCGDKCAVRTGGMAERHILRRRSYLQRLHQNFTEKKKRQFREFRIEKLFSSRIEVEFR